MSLCKVSTPTCHTQNLYDNTVTALGKYQLHHTVNPLQPKFNYSQCSAMLRKSMSTEVTTNSVYRA
jgi:hypothetical protein